jgi:hypothetical protein
MNASLFASKRPKGIKKINSVIFFQPPEIPLGKFVPSDTKRFAPGRDKANENKHTEQSFHNASDLSIQREYEQKARPPKLANDNKNHVIDDDPPEFQYIIRNIAPTMLLKRIIAIKLMAIQIRKNNCTFRDFTIGSIRIFYPRVNLLYFKTLAKEILINSHFNFRRADLMKLRVTIFSAATNRFH